MGKLEKRKKLLENLTEIEPFQSLATVLDLDKAW